MTMEKNEPMDGNEFPGKEDFCFESGVIPLGNLELEIINPPIPGMVFLFMVGPIPLHLCKLWKNVNTITFSVYIIKICRFNWVISFTCDVS